MRPTIFPVTIPDNILPGEEFQVNVGSRVVRVRCPPDCSRGEHHHFIIPIPTADSDPPSYPAYMVAEFTPSDVTLIPTADTLDPPDEDKQTRLFQVEVPDGVQPGTPFALSAGGAHVLVTCPTNAGPGQLIRFKLPLTLLQDPNNTNNELEQIKFVYDKDGWGRVVRVTYLNFQWIQW